MGRRLVTVVIGPLMAMLVSCGEDEAMSAGDADVDRGEQLPDSGSDVGLSDVQSDLQPSDAPSDSQTGTLMCGANRCESLVAPTPVGEVVVDACCASNPPNACGFDTSGLSSFGLAFEDPCQALDQEGQLDAECPRSPVVEVSVLGSFSFAGCCRPEGQCGYLVEQVETLDLGLLLGCVESPFPDDEPGSCTPGAGGGDPDADAGLDMGADSDASDSDAADSDAADSDAADSDADDSDAGDTGAGDTDSSDADVMVPDADAATGG